MILNIRPLVELLKNLLESLDLDAMDMLIFCLLMLCGICMILAFVAVPR